jgi:hypothetical protein
MNQGGLILHIVPFSAFDSAPGLALGQIAQNFQSFVPIGSSTANGARINFDGVLKTSNADPQATNHRAYVQLYRSGIIEALHSTLIASSSGTQVIHDLDDLLIRETIRSLKDLADVGVEPPYALLVSLVGVKGARFNFDRGQFTQWPHDLSDSLDRGQYHFDEVIFETTPTVQAECASIIRPILDQIANIGGRAASRSFDGEGRYIQATR